MEFDIASTILAMGVTFGVGSSTFALIFFEQSLADKKIDSIERRFLHVVFFVLRLGMILIGIGLFLSLYAHGVASFISNIYLWILLGVITLNAILMDKKIMPMKYGPILAGGSWYSLFIATQIPQLTSISPVFVIIGYVIVIFVIGITYRLGAQYYAHHLSIQSEVNPE